MSQFLMRFSLILAAFILFSCKEDQINSTKKEQTSDERYLTQLDALLPHYINPRDYIIMYRYGSIEWTPWSAIICIPKKDLKKESIHVDYFMCNIDMDQMAIMNKPAMTMYSLKIDNPDVGVSPLDLHQLTKMSFQKLNKYLRNLYLNEHVGEGHCANIYLLRSQQSNAIYMLDKTNSSSMSRCLKSICRKISAMEYYQSLSLEKECDVPTDLFADLRLGKELDTFHFAIDYQQLGMY
jgi:hypothetical protein